MKRSHLVLRMCRWGLLAAGTVCTVGQGCMQELERELEILTHPEASGPYFYESYLMDSAIGRALIKWWNTEL